MSKYTVRNGRFGAYFYDEYKREELDLNQVTSLLNEGFVNKAKTEKLKRLLLLTDPVVSNVAVGDTQIRQWNEFISEFPSENCAPVKLTTGGENE